MFRAHFTSTSRQPLTNVVLAFLDQAIKLSKTGKTTIDIMIFSFTSQEIYDKLVLLSKTRNTHIRLLADWGNVSKDNERKASILADLRNSKIEVKFKYDQPYEWDLERDKLQWSYHASLGMLHHKTILLSHKGVPQKLLTGSFNWTKKGAHNYENIVEVTATDVNTVAILKAFNDEFLALWQDASLSLNPAQARMHLAQIKQFYALDKNRTSQMYLDVLKLTGQLEDQRLQSASKDTNTASEQVAFSGSHPFKKWRSTGFAPQNAWRYFNMVKASGLQKRVPLGLTTAALDVIFSANTTSQLCLCMYAISQRVPEYGALLNAARDGVSIKMILDQEANQHIIKILHEKIEQEKLPIQIRAGKRGMHQKYLLDTTKGNLVTGTANMSTDASNRHAEHRFLVKNNEYLMDQFKKDFDTIWKRLES